MRKFIQLLLLVSFGFAQAQTDTVTFQVDLNNYTGSFTTANLNGTFNAWCGACNPMTDANSDGIWEVTLPVAVGAIEYKFTLDGWTAQETLTSGTPCTVTNGGFTNRSYTVAGNATLPVVCWDQCTVCSAAPVLTQVDLPITFDDTTVAYTTVSFGANIDSVVVDPTDPTNNVILINKPITAQTWAGTTVSAGGLATAIPFTMTDNVISVRFWSPDAGIPVLVKTEDANDPTKSVETLATTTVAAAWETLTFDFSAGNEAPGTAAINYATTYDLISIFANFGTDGATAGNKTYYADDFIFGAGGGGGPVLSQIDLPITWEDPTVNYASAAFGGASDTIVVDPTNAANTVMEITKEGNAQTWAGVTVSFGGLLNPVPFTATNTKMTVRVWSPNAGTDVLLKVEDDNDGTISVETIATTTAAATWETLTFDLTNNAAGTPALDLTKTYDVVSVFPNFGTDGATQGGPLTFYIDDVMFDATIGLGEAISLNAFNFSPNPTNGSFDVRLSLDSPEATLSIINLAGKVMHSELLDLNGNNSLHHIDAQSLPKGIYLINVSNGTESHSDKIVID
jgi:hypothetical protein